MSSIRIDNVQVLGLSRIHKTADRTLRYLTIVTLEGIVQIELCSDGRYGATDAELRKKLEVKIEAEPVEQPAAPKHDEGDGA